MTALLVADHDNQSLKPTTHQAVHAALEMAEFVDILVAGNDCEAIAREAARIEGVRNVYYANSSAYTHESAEALADLVVREAQGYRYVLFVANVLGKATMPRVAALMDVSPVSEIVAVKGPKTFVRSMYAGSVLATVEVTEDVVVATLRTTAFPAKGQKADSSMIEEVVATQGSDRSHFVSYSEAKSDRPELVSARVVFAGGAGLNDQAGFDAMIALADQCKAAVGATRTAVDMGLCPNDWQVGQTGKMIAPDLYIGFGISGAIQHTAGIKDAKVVVAVNNDPEAPIFEVADYGLVGDAVEVIQALQSKLAS